MRVQVSCLLAPAAVQYYIYSKLDSDLVDHGMKRQKRLRRKRKKEHGTPAELRKVGNNFYVLI
jgi:hypothetical protein